MTSINILNNAQINCFDIKINQKIIKYSKKSLIKIVAGYYLRNFKSLFKKRNFRKINNIVISHTKVIDTHNYLNNYDKFIRYSELSLSKYQFLKEIIYAPLFLCQYLKLKSINKNQIFEAYLNSRLILKNIEINKINKVIFYGFDYNLTFLFATFMCNARRIKTIHYSNSGYLAEHSLIAANKIYCETKIHKNYMLKRNDLFLTKQENIDYLIKPAIGNKKNEGKIAVYTSGYYARLNKKVHDKDFILNSIDLEKKMLELLKEYAISNKQIQITLFIHLHNNIENINDAKKYYANLLLLDNIKLQTTDENSIENIHRYNLGLCYRSEVFFDRYKRGYKTILYGNSIYFNDFIVNTNLKNVTIGNNIQEGIESIDKYLHMSTSKYFSLLDVETN